jgi:KaiC/GvpD/RAD55 family RecA-like ATPase
MIVIELLSDLLLRNKGRTTRRWLTDFAARRKANGFTILATLDPLTAPQEEIQTIIGVFDGVIEVYERPLQERSRRFLVIKKMYGRNYSENELMLDKQRLL